MRTIVCSHCGHTSYSAAAPGNLHGGCLTCGRLGTKRELKEGEETVMLDHEFNFSFNVFILIVNGIRRLADQLHDPELDAFAVVLERKEQAAATARLQNVRLAGMSFSKPYLRNILATLDRVAPSLPVTPEFAAVGQLRENIRSNGKNRAPIEEVGNSLLIPSLN